MNYLFTRGFSDGMYYDVIDCPTKLYTHYEIEATLISNIFETGQNFRKIKQLTGVFFKKIEKINNNSNTSKQQ